MFCCSNWSDSVVALITLHVRLYNFAPVQWGEISQIPFNLIMASPGISMITENQPFSKCGDDKQSHDLAKGTNSKLVGSKPTYNIRSHSKYTLIGDL